jgi:hypothetical protein
MTDLSRDAQSILDAGRDLDGAGDLEKARVRRALFAKIAAGGAVLTAASTAAADGGGAATEASGAVASSATAPATAVVSASTIAKILVPLAIVAGAVGGAVVWRAQRAMTPTPVVAPAPIVVPLPAAPPAPAAAAAPSLAPAAEPAPAPRPAHHAHVAAPARVETVAPANHLAEETALLASANAQLRRGDAHGALSLLDDYDHRYPSGVLHEEVLATRVIARCQLGPAPDKVARRGASTFLARHPASPLAPRVRSSCGE